ncbi:uncharacterized protein FTOL_07130 [Fusarium torulosum]|uniref:Uncharacterized protein n=1 Tax=Fusarium torulosum TaxID=33205 RepID=A0AAE8MAA7_9HYPO|nr:uncharacterized protein FTOL_07130 [Fusarium torulosum]
MSGTNKPRPSVKRQLKPALQRPGQTLHSPRLKSEVHFAIPGSLPDIDTLRIRTAAVSQPFLDPSSLQNS